MAKIDFLVDIDLNKNQLLNAALQNLAVPPSTTGLPIGFIYWNTAANSGAGTAYAWTGSASNPNTDAGWLDLGQAYTHPTFPGNGQPGSALTGANVISRITLDNGHVTGVTTRALTAADIGAAGTSHTHNFADIIGLPTQTILGNNTGTTGPAKALTVADLMAIMSIGYGNLTVLNTGTDTTQRTYTAKDLTDWLNAKLTGYITAVNLAIGTRTATTMPITNSAGTGVTLPAVTTSLAGLMTSADKTKLDGIATGANNYVHPTVNPGAHPFATELTSGVLVLSQMVVNNEGHVTTIKGRSLTAADISAILFNDASNTATTQTWSASKIYTEIQNVIGQVTTGALTYKGDYNPVTNTPSITTNTGIKTGWTYVVSTDGTFLGEAVEAGDMIIAKVDNPGTTRANWQIVNKNIPAIVSATTLVEGIIRIATQSEAIAGVNSTAAITPATLKAVLDATVGGFAANIGDGLTLTYTVTHALNTQDVSITVYRVSDRTVVYAQTAAPSTTTVTVSFNVAPATGAYRVVIKK
jgi:hypothetical protein